MIGIFIGTLFIGWIIGKLAGDRRGPTYGIIGSLASAGVVLFLILPTGGIFGFLLALIAIAGGLNGGIFSLRQS
jgi:hypothetical protein